MASLDIHVLQVPYSGFAPSSDVVLGRKEKNSQCLLAVRHASPQWSESVMYPASPAKALAEGGTVPGTLQKASGGAGLDFVVRQPAYRFAVSPLTSEMTAPRTISAQGTMPLRSAIVWDHFKLWTYIQSTYRK